MRTPLSFSLCTALISSCIGNETPSASNSEYSYSSGQAPATSAPSPAAPAAPAAPSAAPANPSMSSAPVRPAKTKDDIPKDRLHPALKEAEDECHYIGEWGDCDPFRMIRIKEERLVYGPNHCESRKNSTRHCTRDDLPPGTNWLLEQHKVCIQELQKLKSMIEDLHRYIDQIHQRGQNLFHAYNDLKKRLEDIKRELLNLGKGNHDKEQTILRLREELRIWREKSQKMQLEIAKLNGEIREKEMQVKTLKEDQEHLEKAKDESKQVQEGKRAQLRDLKAINRDLQNSLIDYERYKEEFDAVSEEVKLLKGKIQKANDEILLTRQEIRKTQLELAKPDPKDRYKYNKDTKVNLDMDMWIIHNITKEENPYYYPQLKYGQDPANYPAPTTKYEEPKSEKPKYEEPKYTTPYEEPAYTEPQYTEVPYEEPAYTEAPYEEPAYTEAPYEEPSYAEEPYPEAPYEEMAYTEAPYEEPVYSQAPYQEPKYEEPTEAYPEKPY